MVFDRALGQGRPIEIRTMLGTAAPRWPGAVPTYILLQELGRKTEVKVGQKAQQGQGKGNGRDKGLSLDTR
jgi:hypothetical protein